MTWLLAFGAEILKGTWRLVLWLPRRLRLVKQAKKEAEREVIRLLEEYKNSLGQQLDKETSPEIRQALEEELERVIAAERGYYRKMLERTLERSGLPAYDALVANGKRVLEPENKAKLTEAVKRLGLLPPPTTAEDFVLSALAKDALGLHERALEDLNQALTLRPDFPAALNTRGVVNRHLQRYEQALRDYNRALELRPDFPAALNNRAIVYQRLKRYDEALSDANKAIQLEPDEPTILNTRGNTYQRIGEYEKALADHSRALQLKPDYAEAFNSRGSAYGELGRHEEELADVSRALQLKPDYPDALNNRGISFLRLKRYDEAHGDFNRHRELRPDDPAPVYNMACLFSLWRKPDEAVDCLEKAIALDTKYRQKAATDKDFDNIRDDPRFRKLVEGE